MLGTTIKNRYKLLDKIGGGGMAEVYKATDLYLDIEVAVKILRQQYVNDEDFIKRFRREAQSIQSLSHKNVVDVYDVGEDDDIYYIVMDYVKGQTLKELIQKKGKLPAKEAVEIAKKIVSALDHAHQNNIVHRDIKPHNILLGDKGEVKVTDFGIARAVSETTITQTGSVLGSVHYLSPEQARGGWTDEKTDLYSLGVVLYEMVTGKLPFLGDSAISVALKHLQENFVYPKEINSDLPQSVENIILKALVKDPTKRYASAKDMYDDLDTALNPERIHEKQVQVDTDYYYYDEENTMIIPPIIDPSFDEDNDNYSREGSKMWKIIGRITLLILLSSVIFLGYLGYQNIKAKLTVPDIEVPALEGLTKDQAINKLENLDLTYTLVERNDAVVKENNVIKQDPLKGTVIKANQSVMLYISLGKAKVTVPNVVSKQKGQAKFLLDQEGFKNIEYVDSYDENTPSGVVFKQEPEENKKVVPDETKIMLFISKGKENFKMPNLIGQQEDVAKSIILTNGLKVGNLEYDFTLEQPKGRVYRQFPFDPGRDVTVGDTVDLSISLGYPKEAKTVYGEALVQIPDGQSSDVSIVTNDSRNKDILWMRETITSTKYYPKIELVLMPSEYGTIKVYVDGKLYDSSAYHYQ